MKLTDIILAENSTSTYEYGCVMLYFSFPELKEIHDLIDTKDTYTEEGDQTYGLEDEPHVTLLYGLHDTVSLQDIEKIIDKYTFYTCELKNPSLFESEKYDVLKFDVFGDNLHEINTDLKKYPYTTNFPKYHPHLTVGYLKKGTGKEYINRIRKQELNNHWLAPQYVVYSQPDGKKNKISIKVD